jgi:hypothetical protein
MEGCLSSVVSKQQAADSGQQTADGKQWSANRGHQTYRVNRGLCGVDFLLFAVRCLL